MEETTARFANLKVVEQKTEESPVVTVSFAPGSKTVINETDAGVIDAATKCIHSSPLKTIALDLEGVDLCRVGPVCIVTIGVKVEKVDDPIIFVFDTLNLKKDSPLIDKLRAVLENKEIVKIIHDCKMDADALFHQYNIRLTNVHDTQVWDEIRTHASRPNLNDTLSKNGCATNTFRDGSVYKINPKFWMTRPMTQMMINWACGDVANLFLLQSKQVAAATDDDRRKSESASEVALAIRDKVHAFLVVANPRKFIGHKGSKINSFTRKLSSHGAEFSQVTPTSSKGENFIVYAYDEIALEIVKKRVRHEGAGYSNNYDYDHDYECDYDCEYNYDSNDYNYDCWSNS